MKSLLLIWVPCVIVACGLALGASRVAMVFADQGAFATADFIAAFSWPTIWAALAIATLLSVVGVLYGMRATPRRSTAVAATIGGFELLVFATVFIAWPLLQWGLWLRAQG